MRVHKRLAISVLDNFAEKWDEICNTATCNPVAGPYIKINSDVVVNPYLTACILTAWRKHFQRELQQEECIDLDAERLARMAESRGGAA